MPVRRFEENQEFPTECAPLYDEELMVLLKHMGTTQSICCRDHTNITHTSVGTGLWIYVDLDIFAHLSKYYTPLKACNPFVTLCIASVGRMTDELERIWKDEFMIWWRHYPGIYLEKLRKTMKNLIQDSHSNSAPSE
jgi:hypothetical protein